MSICGHSWCEKELRISTNNAVIVRHRGTIARLSVGGLTVLITATVLGDDDLVVGVETVGSAQDGTATTPLVTLAADDARDLGTIVTSTIERIVTDLAADRDETPDFGETLRARADQERERHGPYLRMGPFDDSPYGLYDQVTEHFTTTDGATDRGASWLLGMLSSRQVEAGETDRTVAREIVDDLGVDAAQVVGSWLFRAS